MRSTAATSCLLAVIKRQYNAKIYKHALAIYNEETVEAVYAYLQQFNRPENDVRIQLEAAVNVEAQRRSWERERTARARYGRYS